MKFLETLQQTIETHTLLPEKVTLNLTNQTISVRSNSLHFLKEIRQYFHSSVSDQTSADIEVIAIQAEQPNGIHLVPWLDWQREPEKKGRKDAFIDLELPAQRLIYKVKTGMVFWQRPQQPTAIGDIESHPNQIINFILNQYLNLHLRQGWILGHAAGLQIQGKGIAIAGLSGGGKSTLMLHLLDHGEHFISNDRLLLAKHPTSVCMRGIPKQPRINPGTIVHNPKLKSLISETDTAKLLALPTEQLRTLEDKYDADVDHFYGSDCYQSQANLEGLVILNWSANTKTKTSLRQTTLNDSPQLLPALMKSPGAFYSDKGEFIKNGQSPKQTPYLENLGDIPCWVLEGQIDFAKAVKLVLEQIH